MKCHACVNGIYYVQGVPVVCRCPLVEGNAVPRPVIQWFAEKMESKLLENDHKNDWIDYDFAYLLMRLKQEVDELEEELEDPVSPNDTIKEAADVANFAMMIADLVNRLKEDPKWGERGR